MAFKVAKVMTEVEASYLAGLLDGEGTITMQKSAKSGMRFPAILIASTSRELVETAQQLCGVGTISTKKVYQEHHRRSYHWTTISRQSLDVGRMVLPYMREHAKRRRLEILLYKWAPMVRRNGRYSVQELNAIRAVVHEFFDGTDVNP